MDAIIAKVKEFFAAKSFEELVALLKGVIEYFAAF